MPFFKSSVCQVSVFAQAPVAGLIRKTVTPFANRSREFCFWRFGMDMEEVSVLNSAQKSNYDINYVPVKLFNNINGFCNRVRPHINRLLEMHSPPKNANLEVVMSELILQLNQSYERHWRAVNQDTRQQSSPGKSYILLSILH